MKDSGTCWPMVLVALSSVAFGGSEVLFPVTKPNNDWWSNKIIYQIYPRSFKDSDNDNDFVCPSASWKSSSPCSFHPCVVHHPFGYSFLVHSFDTVSTISIVDKPLHLRPQSVVVLTDYLINADTFKSNANRRSSHYVSLLCVLMLLTGYHVGLRI